MKNVKIYIIVILIIAFIVGMYGLKLGSMGMKAGNVILFLALFIGSSAFACGLVLLFTRGIRKKLNDEFKTKEKSDLNKEEYDNSEGEA